MKLRLATLTGRNVVPLLPDLARLCTVVFRDWPHLYDGMGVMTLIICRLSPPVRDHSRGLAAIHKAGGITMVLTPAAPPEKGMPEKRLATTGPLT